MCFPLPPFALCLFPWGALAIWTWLSSFVSTSMDKQSSLLQIVPKIIYAISSEKKNQIDARRSCWRMWVQEINRTKNTNCKHTGLYFLFLWAFQAFYLPSYLQEFLFMVTSQLET
jgi:hypothetical protein